MSSTNEQSLHIGIFTDLFHPRTIGGGENRLLHLAREMVRIGNRVTIVTTKVKGSPEEEILETGLRVVRIGRPHPLDGTSLISSIIFVFIGFFMLQRWKNLAFDVIESNTYLPCYLAAIVSKILTIPHIMTIHDVYLSDWIYRLGILLVPFAYAIERGLQKIHANHIVTVSSSSKYKICSILGFDSNQVRVIHNGIPFDEISDYYNESEKKQQIMCLGRLVPHKHVDHVIEALRILHSEGRFLKLVVIGTGPEMKYLENLVHSMKLDEFVELTGFVENPSAVYSELSSSLLFVNASTIEGFGIVLLEAMAAGTPVVAYSLPAYRDFVRCGFNAFLVSPPNPESLSNEIIKLIKNPSLLQSLRENGLETASRFSWNRIALDVLEVYQQVILLARN